MQIREYKLPFTQVGQSNYAWIIAITGALAMFCGLGLSRFAFGMLLPSMLDTLSLSYTQGGMLGFSNLIGYLIAVILSSLVLPYIGTRVTVTSGLFLIASSMFGMAFTTDFTLLCALYLLTGVGSGAVVVPLMSVISQWFLPSHRGIALGLVMAGPGLGITLSGVLIPHLNAMSGFLSWQIGWLIFGCIDIVVALLAYFLIRNHPDDLSQNPFGRTLGATKISTPKQASLSKQPLLTSQYLILQQKHSRKNKIKLLIHLGTIFAIYGATYMIYVTFIVTSMVKSYQLSESYAGSLWAWIGLLSGFSGMLFGWLSDKLGRRLGLMLAFLVLTIAYVMVGVNNWSIGLYLSIITFGIVAWSIPVIMAASAGDYFGPTAAASALAALTVAFSIGQAVGPVIAGYLAELTGDFSLSYLLSAGATIIAIILASFLRPKVSS